MPTKVGEVQAFWGPRQKPEAELFSLKQPILICQLLDYELSRVCNAPAQKSEQQPSKTGREIPWPITCKRQYLNSPQHLKLT